MTAEFKDKIRDLIQNRLNPPISDDDHVFAVTWMTTDTNEQFTTYLVTSKDGRPRFESMLWFSPVEKQCKENPGASRPQETSFQWDGFVKNGFGMQVITWNGNVKYSYQNDKLLTADPCPNRSCLNYQTEFLWDVDNSATTVTTRSIANARPEEAILGYQIIWSVAFPKITTKLLGVEMPAPKGNAIAGSFSFRGDGTWNKNN